MPLVLVERPPLRLNSIDDLVGPLGARPLGRDIHGKVRPSLIILVLEPRVPLRCRELVRLVEPEQQDEGLELVRVEVLDHLLLALLEGVGARKGRHLRVADIGEAALGLVDEGCELVEQKEAGRGVGEGRAQEGVVGAEEADAVQRAAGEVV